MTIHFQGKLAEEADYDRLVAFAFSLAERKGWACDPFAFEETKLLRVGENEESLQYVGPTRGLVIRAHEDCDPIRLEFDQDFYVQEFVKTQFAGAAVHIHVIETLRSVQPFFRHFNVEDEGEFWETGDLDKLVNHIEACNRAIKKMAADNPDVRIKVKTPEGRIIDVIE